MVVTRFAPEDTCCCVFCVRFVDDAAVTMTKGRMVIMVPLMDERIVLTWTVIKVVFFLKFLPATIILHVVGWDSETAGA